MSRYLACFKKSRSVPDVDAPRPLGRRRPREREREAHLHLRMIQNPLLPTSPDRLRLRAIEERIARAVEREDAREALHWVIKRNAFLSRLEDEAPSPTISAPTNRNGQDTQGEQDPRGWNEGAGLPRNGEAHLRRSREVGSDEDEARTHRE